MATPRRRTPSAQRVAALGSADAGRASVAARELTLISLELLEKEAKALLSPGQFAWLGPAGDGWTYQENRRAFDDYPIMPRRLRGVGNALAPGASDEFVRLGRPLPTNFSFGYGNYDPAFRGRGDLLNQKSPSYSDIEFLRQTSRLPVIVKGVLRVDDVRECLEAGAAAIWISNHGGRQLDGVPASISALRGAVDAVAGRVP